MLCILLLLLLVVVVVVVLKEEKVYFSEGSNAVPARPCGKGRLEQGNALGKEGGSMMGSEQSGICGKGQKLSIWTAFCVGRAAL